MVAVSHLDTQWQWTLRDTIARHLPKTLRQNFARFREYPGYVVSFDGAFRYQLIDEYYPDEFCLLKEWVRSGRFAAVGSFLDAADVNIPSPESLFRQILYGNRWFERELGRRCSEIFLPDCFGFGWALPSIAAHCGLRGFSSQKLSKGRSAITIPFALGRWVGPDGRGLLAALEPGGYGEPLEVDLARDPTWIAAIDAQHEAGGPPVALAYYGVGDTGGALDRSSLARLERALATDDGPVRVLTGAAGRIFDELSEPEIARLPEHRGELLLSVHATGCYTSQAAMKRWNRMNEQLGDAAERAAVAAHLFAGVPLPTAELGTVWQRFLVHQFHDDLPGTSLPAAYRLSWNDEALALNQFGDWLTTSVGVVAGELDTRVAGDAVVVFNPLSVEREDCVEIETGLVAAEAEVLQVFDGGEPVPTDSVRVGSTTRVRFVARAPSVGFKVFALRAAAPPRPATDVAVRGGVQSLENSMVRVELDSNADVVRIFDKRLRRDLLAGPLGLLLLPDVSRRFPSWEILSDDVSARPERVGGPATVRVLEDQNASVAVEVIRQAADSSFRQILRLNAGSPCLEIDLEIDWRSRGRLLKVGLHGAVPEPRAIYDLGLGTIERGVNTPKLYEVPAQQWAALESDGAGFGIGLFSDSKSGWDRPQPPELRLSLIHSPRIGHRFRYQKDQDFGRHRVRYGICAYAGSWRSGEIAWRAARFSQPLRGFTAPSHAGRLGAEASLLGVEDPRVAVRACKGAEDGDGVVLRLQELSGAAVSTTLRAPAGVDRVVELNGMEDDVGPEQTAAAGVIGLALSAHQPRTLRLRRAGQAAPSPGGTGRTLDLPFDRCATSRDGAWAGVGFDGRGRTFPAELWPQRVRSGEAEFLLGPADGPNALACRGQALALDLADDSRLLLLAASVRGDREVGFATGDGARSQLLVPDWCDWVGRWNRGAHDDADIKRVPVAFVATHRHGWRGNQPYRFCYMFRLEVPIARGAREVRLPRDPGVRLFAAALVPGLCPPAVAGGRLYD